jgi:hypothetical protein
MEVSGQLHAPSALPSEKDLPLFIEQEAGWAPKPVWKLWRRDKILAPAGTRTTVLRTSIPYLRYCTDYTLYLSGI